MQNPNVQSPAVQSPAESRSAPPAQRSAPPAPANPPTAKGAKRPRKSSKKTPEELSRESADIRMAIIASQDFIDREAATAAAAAVLASTQAATAALISPASSSTSGRSSPIPMMLTAHTIKQEQEGEPSGAQGEQPRPEAQDTPAERAARKKKREEGRRQKKKAEEDRKKMVKEVKAINIATIREASVQAGRAAAERRRQLHAKIGEGGHSEQENNQYLEEINRIRGEEITRQAKVRKNIEDIETAVDTVELDSTTEDHPSEPDQPQPQPRSQVSAQKKRKEK